SADKSWSITWAFANPQEQAAIYDAHIQAGREAVAYMAKRIGVVRLGDGGKDGSEQGHVGWIEFTHHTARKTQFAVENGEIVSKTDAAVGDMDLHTHRLIPNAVFSESGKVGSIDSQGITGFIKEAGAVYQMRFASSLMESGFNVELDPKTGSAVNPDISDDLRNL